MNWIKNNTFVSALAAGVIIICGILLFLGTKSGGRLEEAKESFDQAYQAVSKSERSSLYPKPTTRDAKKKALEDYRESIEELRSLYDGYRVEMDSITTQEFTERLKSANSEVSDALTAAGSDLPDGFFMGFDRYRNQLAQSEATGLLDYQLKGLKHALMDLAEARPSSLISVYRESIPEENGAVYTPGPDEVARKFGFEVVFKGSEASARKFVSALGDIEPFYYVVRSIKIQNERTTPPRVSDAEFPTAPAAPAVQPDNPFGVGFFDGFEAGGDEEEQPAVDEGEGQEEPAVEVERPAAAVDADSSRILAQVLGAEEVFVFVRFDLTLFSPVKELPKP